MQQQDDGEDVEGVQVADTYFPPSVSIREDDHTTVAPVISTTLANGRTSENNSSDVIVFVDVDVSTEIQKVLDHCSTAGWIVVAPVDQFTAIPDHSHPTRKYVLVVAAVEKRQGHLLTDRTIQYLKVCT